LAFAAKAGAGAGFRVGVARTDGVERVGVLRMPGLGARLDFTGVMLTEARFGVRIGVEVLCCRRSDAAVGRVRELLVVVALRSSLLGVARSARVICSSRLGVRTALPDERRPSDGRPALRGVFGADARNSVEKLAN
jgi:hypothetical protein